MMPDKRKRWTLEELADAPTQISLIFEPIEPAVESEPETVLECARRKGWQILEGGKGRHNELDL
jgi:hypothetical protein